MAENQKKDTAKLIRELNLYADRSKEENTIRGIVWIVSWVIGIVTQQVTSAQVLGGAYFVFSLSLLLEFVPERKDHRIAQGVHGSFCVLLVLILLGSVLLVFEDVSTNRSAENSNCSIMSTVLFVGSCLIVIWIFVSTVLALTEAHKFFYVGEEKICDNDENSSSELRELFINNLQIPTSYVPESRVKVPAEILAEATSRVPSEGENL